MTTAAAKKKKAAEAETTEAPVEDPEPAAPERTTEVSWSGMTAFDTVDGVAQAARPATLSEQLTMLADEILRLVVGSVPYATSGSIELDGEKLTIQLVSH